MVIALKGHSALQVPQPEQAASISSTFLRSGIGMIAL
jgi:hypothetical protein